MSLERYFLQNLKKQKLVRPGDKVLLGVSGGADSVALLYLFQSVRIPLSCRLHVVHVNHQLRKTAGRDERFVKNLCAGLQIPCTSIRLKIKKKGSLEEQAREERYKVFQRVAKGLGVKVIALAHHQDDLAETVLMRILRGTGLQGLQAILPQRKINDYLVIRPLLNFSRNDILDFLKKKRIAFCHDETNEQTVFFRNKIRLKLLPLLQKEYQPNIQNVLANLSWTATADYDYLRGQALKSFPHLQMKKKKVKLSLKKLQTMHPALRRMAFRLALENRKGNSRVFTLAHLQEIETLADDRPDKTKILLPAQISVFKNKNVLEFC